MTPPRLRLLLAALALPLLGACAHAASPTNLLPPAVLAKYPEGGPLDLGGERGNVLVLDFWATWCEPCKAALPEWETLAASYRDRGVRLYAVSVDEDLNKLAEFLREVKVTMPVLVDHKLALSEGQLHLTMVPTAVFIDRNGYIRSTHQGYAPADVKTFAKEIDPLLNEK
jgi:thiol-disulfide isomerase/thioredoxin